MREEHCYFAILNGNGRCVANCHWNWSEDFKQDCKGITRLDEDDFLAAGREVIPTGGERLD